MVSNAFSLWPLSRMGFPANLSALPKLTPFAYLLGNCYQLLPLFEIKLGSYQISKHWTVANCITAKTSEMQNWCINVFSWETVCHNWTEILGDQISWLGCCFWDVILKWTIAFVSDCFHFHHLYSPYDNTFDSTLTSATDKRPWSKWTKKSLWWYVWCWKALCSSCLCF